MRTDIQAAWASAAAERPWGDDLHVRAQAVLCMTHGWKRVPVKRRDPTRMRLQRPHYRKRSRVTLTSVA